MTQQASVGRHFSAVCFTTALVSLQLQLRVTTALQLGSLQQKPAWWPVAGHFLNYLLHTQLHILEADQPCGHQTMLASRR